MDAGVQKSRVRSELKKYSQRFHDHTELSGMEISKDKSQEKMKTLQLEKVEGLGGPMRHIGKV